MCTELLPPGGYPTAVNKIYNYFAEVLTVEGDNAENGIMNIIILLSYLWTIIHPVKQIASK
jgi:hypothetical protein